MVFDVLHTGPVHAVGFADGDQSFFTANKPLSKKSGTLMLSVFDLPSNASERAGSPPQRKAADAAHTDAEEHEAREERDDRERLERAREEACAKEEH